ncbi:MAG: NAD-dependent epimerase/dehydratase family protein [Candidatus Altiarchaeales archaeon]|nr:NAD-dependent epimerase/dehydratase family protein [Candidatus Altiarchaeales archaeon]
MTELNPSLEDKNIMVTGGAGFIGSYLVDRLVGEKLRNIVVLDNMVLGKMSNLSSAIKRFPKMKVYKKDALSYNTVKSILKKEDIEVVFNLAVLPLKVSLIKPKWTFTHNVDITVNLCELLRLGHYKTLIHCSSSEAYGTSEYAPMDENHPLNPTTPYAASKAACDNLIYSYYRTFGIDMSILRPFNNYGPRQNEGTYAGVVPITIKRILSGKPPVIHGDGLQTRDFTYVTDTADAMIKIYNSIKTRGRILNIGSGVETSIKDLITLIAEKMCWRGKILHQKERPGDVRRHISNCFLIRDLFGFYPKVGLNQGLENTIKYYKNNSLSK